jgi:hypothetical protein
MALGSFSDCRSPLKQLQHASSFLRAYSFALCAACSLPAALTFLLFTRGVAAFRAERLCLSDPARGI